MSEILNIPRKDISDMQKFLLKKCEAVEKNIDDAEEDIRQLNDVIDDYEEILDALEKRKGYSKMNSEYPPTVWRAIHKKDDDITPEEHEALIDIRPKRSQLEAAREQYNIESAKLKAYTDAVEMIGDLLNY